MTRALPSNRWKFCGWMALCTLLLVVAPSTAPSKASAAGRSDVNIVIAVDCSWSVSSVEYALQVNGIAEAVSDPEVISAIRAGARGRIGLTLTQWAISSTQIVSIPWTQIANRNDALAFAQRAANAPRRMIAGGTSISGAMLHGLQQLDSAPFRADRRVVDVITDGTNNNGLPTTSTRDVIVAQDITINALAVINEKPSLATYLNDYVIGGPGAFVEPASDYKDFVNAFRRKLLREIRGTPFASRKSRTQDKG